MKFTLNELKHPDKTIIPIEYLDTREPEILTDEYVSTLNREIAYRLRQCDERLALAESDTSMYPLMGNAHVNTRKLSR